MIRILLCALLLFSAAQVRAQAREQSEPYKTGQINLGIGSTHLFQSEWQPYQDQITFDLTYIWNTQNRQLLMDAGFSWSFDLYDCSTCTASATVETVDAAIFSLHFGVGKWWRGDKASAAITGGVLAGFSEYTKYTTANGIYFSNMETSDRGHAGVYIRSAVDFSLTDRGLRLGPFMEYRLSSGSLDKNLDLNINSFTFGLYLGWRKEH